MAYDPIYNWFLGPSCMDPTMIIRVVTLYVVTNGSSSSKICIYNRGKDVAVSRDPWDGTFESLGGVANDALGPMAHSYLMYVYLYIHMYVYIYRMNS